MGHRESALAQREHELKTGLAKLQDGLTALGKKEAELKQRLAQEAAAAKDAPPN